MKRNCHWPSLKIYLQKSNEMPIKKNICFFSSSSQHFIFLLIIVFRSKNTIFHHFTHTRDQTQRQKKLSKLKM